MANKIKKHQLKKSEISDSIVPDYNHKAIKHNAIKHKPIIHPHPHPHPHPHNVCGCEQLFYSPLPNLAVRPPTERIGSVEWFAPGSVQACCSICSTVKPVYACTYQYSYPYAGYCCRN